MDRWKAALRNRSIHLPTDQVFTRSRSESCLESRLERQRRSPDVTNELFFRAQLEFSNSEPSTRLSRNGAREDTEYFSRL